MRERIRAARDWAMESPKRAILTGIAAVVIVGLTLTLGSTLNLFTNVTAINSSRPTATATVPTLSPQDRATGGVVLPPTGPQDGATPTGSAAPWPGTSQVDRLDPGATAGEFVRRYLDGAGRGAAEREDWRERVAPLASPALRADLARTDMSKIPAAQLTLVSEASVVADQATVTATISTGRILVVRLVRVAGDDGAMWAVSGLTT